ncbi:MAG: alpha/beta hydrolase family protein [Bacteroidales bacterium]
MKNFNYHLIRFTVFSSLILLFTEVPAQEKRAMTLEDVMNFRQIQHTAVSHDGNWVAYSASPDRGDGFGVVVSADKRREYIIERAERPEFSLSGNWVLFTKKPLLADTEGKAASDRPKDKAVLINTRDGSQVEYNDVKESAFSTSGKFMFIHHQFVADTSLTKEQNDKLRKAGTPLFIKELESGSQATLQFVNSWTVDSLSTSLVFAVKDTIDRNNGLYHLSLRDINSAPVAVDTTGNSKFGTFTWYQKESKLAYMRALEMEKDTVETGILFIWQTNQSDPGSIVTQDNTPDGYFLPYNNNLSWSRDGKRLFFGFRPDEYAARSDGNRNYASVLDSIQQQAGIDIWHGEDLLIKTHEKAVWNQTNRQNLISVIHLDERKIVQLADKDVTDVQLSGEGNFVLASTVLPHSKRITWEGRFRDIYAVNIHTGAKQLVATEQRDVAAISPNSEFILYFDQENWHVYETATGKRRNLTQNSDVQFFDETNDLPASPSSYRTAGWMEDGESVLLYDRYDVWNVNLASGKMFNVTGGEGRKNQTIFRIRKLNNEPLFGRREEVFLEGFNENTKERAIYSTRLDRLGVNLVLDEGINIKLRILSGDGKNIVFTRESYDIYPDLLISGTRMRNPVKLSDLGSQTEQFNWGSAELISFESADEEPLQGVVIKPGDYDPSKKYPVFVYYYEKSSQRLHDFNQTLINHRPSFGYYASNGYVIFLPDIHFTEGRPGMSAVNSLVPGVQKLIDTGIADPEAIGLHGHSWSGYQTAFVVTQTDIFKAAIAGAPVSNMTSAYGGIRWGSGLARQFQYETGQSRIGYSIFEQPDLYIENSPLFYADNINTPMLIMHGDVDEAVPWEQSIELYLAMRRAGKDVIFLQYRGEPHHPQKYENKVDYTVRMKEYFDYHLRGSDPPDWVINGVPYMGN